MKKPQSLLKKLFSGSGWALFTVFVWELLEEGLEELIAFTLTSTVAIFVTKALSTLAVITATQGIKLLLKRTLKPIIKSLTYKEGIDKMTKIKKFFTWLWSNKKTLSGILSGAVMTLSGTGVIDLSVLPELPINGFNITPILYYGVLLILTLIGISGKGFESIKEFAERIAIEKQEKENKKVEKIAEAELKAEEKLANQTQAEQEKANAKKQAEEKAKAEKEKAEAEFRAKVNEVKTKLKIEAIKKKAENQTTSK